MWPQRVNEICPKLQQALGVAVLAARLPASSLAPRTSQMVSWHWPTTCEGKKANDQVPDFSFGLGFQPHQDIFNVPGKVGQSGPNA